MTVLSIGDQLASIGGFLITVTITVFNIVNVRRQARRHLQADTLTRLSWVLRYAVTVLLFAVGLALTLADDLEYMFLFLPFLAWLNVGDLGGRILSIWAEGPPPPDLPVRLRTADWVGRWLWLISMVAFAVLLLAFPLSLTNDGWAKVQLVSYSWASLLVGYLPHQMEIRSRLRQSHGTAQATA